MAFETKKQGIVKYLILLIIPLAFFSAGLVIVYNTDTPTVVKHEGFQRDGYPDVPTVYEVTASPHKTFIDTWANLKALIILGFILAVAGPVVYFALSNAAGKESSFLVAAIFWAIGLFFVFGISSVKRTQVQYHKTFSESEYTANAGNLDSFFPKQ